MKVGLVRLSLRMFGQLKQFDLLKRLKIAPVIERLTLQPVQMTDFLARRRRQEIALPRKRTGPRT